MPQNVIGDPPFPPVILFDDDRAFSLADLQQLKQSRPTGVTICVRYADGPPKRGGYFFHFRPSLEEGTFDVFDFEQRLVKALSAEFLVAFINHCTGRAFDENSFVLCQTELNFLKDDEPSA